MGKRIQHYFKFTLDSYKKLSRIDLLDIIMTNIKNDTFESTLFNIEYIKIIYLIEKGYPLSGAIHVIPDYRLIKDNTYIGRFYYDNDTITYMYCEYVKKACFTGMKTLFYNLDEEDKENFRKSYPYKYFDDDSLIKHYVNPLYMSCNNLSTKDFDNKFTNFISYISTYQERQMLKQYYNKFLDFYNNEFQNCYNKANKHQTKEYYEFKELYDSLAI